MKFTNSVAILALLSISACAADSRSNKAKRNANKKLKNHDAPVGNIENLNIEIPNRPSNHVELDSTVLAAASEASPGLASAADRASLEEIKDSKEIKRIAGVISKAFKSHKNSPDLNNVTFKDFKLSKEENDRIADNWRCGNVIKVLTEIANEKKAKAENEGENASTRLDPPVPAPVPAPAEDAAEKERLTGTADTTPVPAPDEDAAEKERLTTEANNARLAAEEEKKKAAGTDKTTPTTTPTTAATTAATNTAGKSEPMSVYMKYGIGAGCIVVLAAISYATYHFAMNVEETDL